MPAKGSKKEFLEGQEQGGGQKWEQFAFINLDLSKAQSEALKALPIWNEEWSHFLDDATKAGFQISMKVDSFNSCFAAYMQIRLRSHPCFGFILSGRGSTQIKALRQLLYKHYVVLKEDWTKVKPPEPSAYDD